MKKIIIAIIFLFASSYLMAQDDNDFKHRKWKLSSAGISASTYSSRFFSNLSHESLYSLVKNPDELVFDMEGYELESEYEMWVEYVGVYLRLNKPISKGFSQELSLGMNFYTYAEVYVDYEKEYYDGNDYLGWCLLQGRFELESTYFMKYSLNRFNIKAGPAISFGSSFNDKVMLFDEVDNYEPSQITAAKSTQFLLTHFSIELSAIVLKRFELSFGNKFGIGWQLGEDNYINKTNTTTLGLGYLLKR